MHACLQRCRPSGYQKDRLKACPQGLRALRRIRRLVDVKKIKHRGKEMKRLVSQPQPICSFLFATRDKKKAAGSDRTGELAEILAGISSRIHVANDPSRSQATLRSRTSGLSRARKEECKRSESDKTAGWVNSF